MSDYNSQQNAENTENITSCFLKDFNMIKEILKKNSWDNREILKKNSWDNRETMGQIDNSSSGETAEKVFEPLLKLLLKCIKLSLENSEYFALFELRDKNQHASALSEKYSMIGPLEVEFSIGEMEKIFEESKKIDYKQILQNLDCLDKAKRMKNVNITD